MMHLLWMLIGCFGGFAYAEPILVSSTPLYFHGHLRAISPDKMFVAIAEDYLPRVRIFSLDTGGLVSEVKLPQSNTSTYGSALKVPILFSPDSTELIIGHFDGQLEAFDVVTGQSVRRRQHGTQPISALAVRSTSQNRNLLLLTTLGGTSLWDYDSFYQLIHIPSPAAKLKGYLPEDTASYFCSAIHLDGALALEANRADSHVHLYDLQNGVEILDSGDPVFFSSWGHKGLPDGSLRAAFQDSHSSISILHTNSLGVVEWIDLQLGTWKCTSNLIKDTVDISGLTLSGNGEYTFFVPRDLGNLKSSVKTCASVLAHPRTGPQRETLDALTEIKNVSTAISHDGKRTALISEGTLFVWDIP